MHELHREAASIVQLTHSEALGGESQRVLRLADGREVMRRTKLRSRLLRSTACRAPI